jgi:glucose-6-phosphate isomerase
LPRTIGVFDLPGNRALHQKTRDFVCRQRPRPRAEAFTNVVVLRIGGSALGPIAVRKVLCVPQWNPLDDEVRGGRPLLHVLEHVKLTSISASLLAWISGTRFCS